MGRKRLIAALLLAATPVLADYDPDAYPPYETCALCHGLFGVSHTFKFPHLGGQDPVYIEAQIRAFLSGDRHNDGGQMVAIVSELKPEEIPVVVEWFSTQDPPAPTPQGDTSAGRALFDDTCTECHGDPTLLDGVPHLKSQHLRYLVKQMEDFRDGRRGPGPLEVDHGPLIPVADADIEALAAYLAAEPRE